MIFNKQMNDEQLLRWHLDGGVNETIVNIPVNRLQAVKNKHIKPSAEVLERQPTTAVTNIISDLPPFANQDDVSVSDNIENLPPSPSKAGVISSIESNVNGELSAALQLSQNAKSINELRMALEAFDGCALKKTATNLVFIDGSTDAEIMLIGEGPGAEEDRKGIPFVGASGKLLDKMLLSVGLDRKKVLISNTIFWRPPGNRTPTPQEISTCLPFVERMIQLVAPKIIVALGGHAAKLLLVDRGSIGRIRGKWHSYSTPKLSKPIATTAIFHPAYLLRSPAQKRDTWKDWQIIKRKLNEQ
jgi:DNA polymerase